MFGNSALFHDEFRLLLKEQLGFDEVAGPDPTKLASFSRLACVHSVVVDSWVRGLGRPTPPQERTLIAMMKSVMLHSQTL